MKSLKKLLSVRKPTEVFQFCPACKSKNLIPVDGDVICSSCSWDSITLYADALFEQQVGPLFDKSKTKMPDPLTNGTGSTAPEVSIVA